MSDKPKDKPKVKAKPKEKPISENPAASLRLLRRARSSTPTRRLPPAA